MLITFYTIILAFSAFIMALAGTALLVWLLPRLQVLDHPEERSNHTKPIPRGGGLSVMIAAIGFLIVARAPAELMLGAVVLTVISFMDDRSSLPVRMRLAIQGLAVVYALLYMEGLVFQGLFPWWLDLLGAAFLWLWFTNLYNFMDGIDEISAVQTVSMMTGLVILTLSEPLLVDSLAVDGAIIAAAVMGFWWFNRHPAKIFLGDAGSIPLGFLCGYLLIKLATEGFWQAALILPAYYLCDASVTLLRRMSAGKKISEAHSEHAYQKAVRQGGRSHTDVARHVLALNMILVTLAVVSLLGGIVALLALVSAYVLALMLMAYFSRPAAAIPAHGETA